MYCLAAIQFVTDKQTDRQTDDSTMTMQLLQIGVVNWRGKLIMSFSWCSSWPKLTLACSCTTPR